MHQNVYLPEEFLQEMKAIMPNGLDISSFINACQRPLRKSIRINTLKISISDFTRRASEKNWQLSPIPWCKEGFWIEADESVTPLGNTAEHMCGLFYIQEASSMMPVSALFDNQYNEFDTVLDMAAAPGSKTSQIAARMNNNGVIVANEFSSSRVKALHANVQRCGIRNTALSNYDGRVFGGWLPECFDAVLIDAPCTGEGTVRKDPDAMKNWSKETVLTISETQKDLIDSAFHALKPGGVMVYSTCTLSVEENQQVCLYLKDKYQGLINFEPLDSLFDGAEKAITEHGFLHVFPQTFDCEGFFVAKLKKLGTVKAPEVNKRLGKFPYKKATNKVQNHIASNLYASLNIELPEKSCVWLRDSDVWLFPNALEPLLESFRFSRMGIKIAESHKNGYRWQHQVATTLASGKELNCIELTIAEAREWFMGRDIRPVNQSGKGEVIVKLGDDVIGLGKWVGNRLKNGLPRELVRDKNLF
ncbi:16S rRNA (cytosine(1407)-C(5))-methyltransferase RsmF [Vibrio hepatarius]|uniref:16S rRNA (cytosine(1407)-C(5))-methyltransferase RsmF n=1 Tax=Vibrio hepatarius TaxID=171383 RepID=UPI001C0920D5|nr:16S rRNA (cytosine(1407)-C(5))-methyltransferase RsmF [Vibrio hepatarius]MBU2898860.1 16S rRNA (cytosine(1407)-C(5))-methyltransferase RsmF [Vibrio hepatarius]